MRVLIAGVGNVLRGDDGFGPAVVHALNDRKNLPADIRAVEMGIGGIGLIHELMQNYDALIVVDAVDRGGSPGSLYVLDLEVPEVDDLSEAERYRLSSDIHQAVPNRTLVLARAAGVLPPIVRMVGCQPADTEEFCTDLSPLVRESADSAVDRILEMCAEWTKSHASEIALPNS